MKIGYARVSTRDQSLQSQVDSLKEAGCEKIYQEVASGAKNDRPILEDLLKNIREGDTLVVWKFDRLARNLRHFLNVIDELDRKKVNFVSVTDQVDTTTAFGKFMFSLNALYAELERNIGLERSQAGLKAARARGKIGGRPKGLSETAKEKSKIAEVLYRAGDISVARIANQLKVSSPTVYVYLKYRGVEIGKSPIKKVLTCQTQTN